MRYPSDGGLSGLEETAPACDEAPGAQRQRKGCHF